MNDRIFEYLKSINEECAIIEKRSDGNYHIVIKKHMINNISKMLDKSNSIWYNSIIK